MGSPYYYDRLRPVWLLGVLTAATSSLFGPLAFGSTLISGDNLSTAVMFGGFMLLAAPPNVWLHSVLVPGFLALLIWDVVAWHPVFVSS